MTGQNPNGQNPSGQNPSGQNPNPLLQKWTKSQSQIPVYIYDVNNDIYAYIHLTHFICAYKAIDLHLHLCTQAVNSIVYTTELIYMY